MRVIPIGLCLVLQLSAAAQPLHKIKLLDATSPLFPTAAD